MATVSRSVTVRKPGLAPVSGRVRMLVKPGQGRPDAVGKIAIDDHVYLIQCHEAGYRLCGKCNQNGEPVVYDLPLSLGSCDCPDATYRSERPGGCKHRRALEALKAAGKLDAA